MKKEKIITIIGIVFLLVLVFAYTSNQFNSNIQENNEIIKIGVVHPLSGFAAIFGESSLAGIQVYVDEINASGGINGKQIELIVEDDACSADGGVKAMKKLVYVDKVDGIISTYCSGSASPSLGFANDEQIPVIISGATRGDLTEIGEYIFRVAPSDNMQGRKVAEYIVNQLGSEKIAVIYVKNAWGEPIDEIFVNRVQELGSEIVYNEGILPEETDLKNSILKIKETDAEVLYFPVYADNELAGIKQMSELNFDIPIISAEMTESEGVLNSEYSENLQYILGKIEYPDILKEKINSYPEYQNKDFVYSVPLGYDSAKVLIESFIKSENENRDIQKVISETSIQGMSTPLIEFDSIGDLKNSEFEIRIVIDNKTEHFADIA